MKTFQTGTLPEGLRLAVSPLSWANDVLEDLGADIPLETCLEEAAAAGYAGMELGRKMPRSAAELTPLFERRDLALVSGWHSGQLAEGDVESEMAAVAAHAELLRAMGARVMVYGETAMMAPGAPLDLAMSVRKVMPKEAVAGYAARLSEFARRLDGEYGLALAYHHHLMMVAETFDEISALLDRTAPEVGLLLDTGHAAAAGFDYTRLIDRYGERISHVHLKDVRSAILAEVRARDLSFNDAVRSGLFTVPGDGMVDFAPLAAFVRDSGYRGWLVVEAEQDPSVVPPFPAVTAAFQHVTRIFGAEPEVRTPS